LDKGFCGLAVRINRRVYLSPIETDDTLDDPGPSAYVNESIPHFVDARKKPECKYDPNYKPLINYYKVCKEKVYADFVFLIKYKQIILGVIDVKVTQKNWGRFIGIGYLHLFKTLADMLALFFYHVRLAEEHSRVVKAVK
jgi:hypothetical protein